MELSLVILKQILLMFIYMAIGVILYKKKIVTEQGSKELGKMLLYVIMSALILKSYLIPFSEELLRGLLLSCLASVAALVISVLISKAAFGSRHPIEQFGSAFSNAGFIGIPLVEMMFGDSMAVFYVSSFVAVLNILQWTYGLVVMTGKRDSIMPEKIITNPIIISFLCGIILFCLPIQLPETINSAVTAIASMNAPIAMIVLGIYLAQMNLKDLFTDKMAYYCSFMRLVVIPLVTVGVLALIPGNEMLKMSVLIVAATPVGSNVAIFAQMEDMDYTQAVKDICLSTVLCVVTIPVIVMVAGMAIR